MTTKTVDPKCYDLAYHFLFDEEHLDTEKNRMALADAIQVAIEDWFTDLMDNYEPPEPPSWEGGFADNH
jgi:hypothetical protein